MIHKTIHFVGIKGVGMTPLALIAKEAGAEVSGSDIPDPFITDEPLSRAGIVPFKGFTSKQSETADLIITTGAHGGYDNPEVIAAREKNIPVLTQGEAVGEFMKGELFERQFRGISVSGTHGKTTTTALIATLLTEAGLDPSYVIGTSTIPTLSAPGHFGQGAYFIAEADEYATEPKQDKTPKFLWQHPEILVITNIEHDHPDMYSSLDDVIIAFTQFVNQLDTTGSIIAYGDDANVMRALENFQGEKKTYGEKKDNMYVIQDYTSTNGISSFSLLYNQRVLARFDLSVIGLHNVLNATAAIVTALTCGLDVPTIQTGLLSFTGSKRRAEFIGTLSSGARLFDDYAHHPTEIKKTLRAFKEAYPEKTLVCIFQPHTYSRTKELFDDFVTSFTDCDQVILCDIYSSRREVPDSFVSSELLVQKLIEQGVKAVYLKTLSDVIQYVSQQKYGTNTLLVTMGAGDIYTIKDSLL